MGTQFRRERAKECDRGLVDAYRSALRLAESDGARAIEIPAISTGIYDVPMERVAPPVDELSLPRSLAIENL